MSHLNFLYCFDENYNTQAFVSINSLLKNIDEKVNIYIIHKNPASFINYYNSIIKNENINDIKISEFKLKNHDFPKLKNAHVSEATYYRIFAEEYVDVDIDFLIYLDADIICLNNPLPLLHETILNLKNTVKPVAARTEGMRNDYENWTKQEAEKFFRRLDLKGNNYFNAGVLVMNFNMWKDNDTQKSLISILEKYKKNIIYWDQDLLNKAFDNNFMDMSNSLNFNLGIFDNPSYTYEYVKENICFLHFSGKGKPWNLEFIQYKNSNFYQDEFREISSKKYHVVTNKKLSSFFFIIKNLINLRIFDYDYPLEFFKGSIKSLVTSKK